MCKDYSILGDVFSGIAAFVVCAYERQALLSQILTDFSSIKLVRHWLLVRWIIVKRGHPSVKLPVIRLKRALHPPILCSTGQRCTIFSFYLLIRWLDPLRSNR
jgi:hypothetical protein